MKMVWLMIACILLPFGCGEPRADATSPEAWDASYKRLTANMDGDEQRQFYEAVKMLQKVDQPTDGEVLDQAEIKAIEAGRLHGKTVQEIYAAAKEQHRARAPYRLREMKESATNSFKNGPGLAGSYRVDAQQEAAKLEAVEAAPAAVDAEGQAVEKEPEIARLKNRIAAYEKAAAALAEHGEQWREFALWVDETRDIDEAQQKYDAVVQQERHIYAELSAALAANEPKPVLVKPAKDRWSNPSRAPRQ